MKRNYWFYVLIFVLIVLISFSVLEKQKMEYTTHITGVMDTTSDITVITKADGTKIINDISDLLYKYDEMFSHTNVNSDIYKLNNSIDTDISSETYDIIQKCKEFYDDTNGSFDITVGAVAEVWNETFKTNKLPDFELLKSLVDTVSYENLNFTDEKVKITEPNQKIILGSVVKGYSADKIKDYLNESKADDALINLGGNIYAKGKNKNNNLWNIGIQDPVDENELLLLIKVKDKFVVTSGNYIRYADIDSVRYHHIIDAKTGFPVQNELNSVTIISDSGFVADALSTSCFIMGFEESKSLLEKYGVFAVFATKDNKVFYSEKIENSIEKINKNYEYIPF